MLRYTMPFLKALRTLPPNAQFFSFPFFSQLMPTGQLYYENLELLGTFSPNTQFISL